jgi:hypothetical protein
MVDSIDGDNERDIVTESGWYSTKIRYAVLIEGTGLVRYMDSVLLLKADDFDDLFRRTLDRGKRDEKEFLNGDGQRVRWRLASIISVDWVGEEIADWQEVYSEPVSVPEDEDVPFEHEFQPETSSPTQTR